MRAQIRRGAGPSPARHRAARVHHARPAAPHTVFLLFTLPSPLARASTFISSRIESASLTASSAPRTYSDSRQARQFKAADPARTTPRTCASPVHTRAPLLRPSGSALAPGPGPAARSREREGAAGPAHSTPHLPSAHAPFFASPSLARAPAPVSWSAHPRRTSSLLQLARHPEARHATLSLRLAHPRLVCRLRIGPDISLVHRCSPYRTCRSPASDAPLLLFPPLHILPCAEQAKSGKRIPHASPSSPFADAERGQRRVPRGDAHVRMHGRLVRVILAAPVSDIASSLSRGSCHASGQDSLQAALQDQGKDASARRTDEIGKA
ncbi:hypothetical protein DFH08DRAFT_396013 [Mycena albidolilacea]|uniref:Uncharacterized protein n=1 Tax=Mycena albidolilacea TaxID=1033008 RepID=A0AAD6ZE10_9AGAR|nr:hypothetical protein DFH08DRAFT_396013 [Mycena albidolilacea]